MRVDSERATDNGPVLLGDLHDGREIVRLCPDRNEPCNALGARFFDRLLRRFVFQKVEVRMYVDPAHAP
jgi:hypothetical protein